jgi:hypothetical protein
MQKISLAICGTLLSIRPKVSGLPMLAHNSKATLAAFGE